MRLRPREGSPRTPLETIVQHVWRFRFEWYLGLVTTATLMVALWRRCM